MSENKEALEILRKNPDSISPEHVKGKISDFLGFCAASDLPLDSWHSLAVSYYEYNKISEFLEIVNYVMEYELDKSVAVSENDLLKKRQFYITFASYYLYKAACETESEKRNDYFTQAIIKTNTCVKRFLQESRHFGLFSLKGYVTFLQGELEQARTYFIQGIEENPSCIISILGKASLDFATQNYVEAVNNYRKALQINPKLPAKVRLGLGYCYYNMGKYEIAYETFSRVLELEPLNIEATIALASLEFKAENYEKYREYLEKAYSLNPNHPMVLLHLAENSLISNNLVRAKKFAIRGYQNLLKVPKSILDEKTKEERLSKSKNFKNDFLRAKSRFLYIIAFAYHNQGKPDWARKFYQKACTANPENFSSWYGLSQLHISEKQYSEALESLSFVGQNPNIKFEQLYKVLGYLNSRTSKRNQAVEYYKKAKKFDPNDFETLIEYASLQEAFDLVESHDSYIQALNLFDKFAESMKSENEIDEETEYVFNEKQLRIKIDNKIFELQPELYNNLAVIKNKLGKNKEALEYYEKALALTNFYIENRADNLRYRAISSTINFNMASLNEDIRRIGDAVEIFKRIIQENPYYIDAYLRLAYLQFKRGNIPGALDYCSRAQSRAEKVESVRQDSIYSLKGFIFEMEEDEYMATRSYEDMRKKFNDSYSKINILKLNYEASVKKRDTRFEQKKFLTKMIDLAKSTLNNEENNIQIAMFIGIIMAETGWIKEAKAIFKNLSIHNEHNPLILVNTAHVEFLQEEYEYAISLYTLYLQKINAPDEHVEMCIVICYTMLERFEKAITLMKKLVLKNPDNLIYRFNLNVLLGKWATHTYEKPNKTREEMQKVIKTLHTILASYKIMFSQKDTLLSRQGQIRKSESAMKRKKELFDKIRERSENEYNFKKNDRDKYNKKEQELSLQEKHSKIRPPPPLNTQKDTRKKLKVEDSNSKEEERERKRLEAEQEMQRLREKFAEFSKESSRDIKGKKAKGKRPNTSNRDIDFTQGNETMSQEYEIDFLPTKMEELNESEEEYKSPIEEDPDLDNEGNKNKNHKRLKKNKKGEEKKEKEKTRRLKKGNASHEDEAYLESPEAKEECSPKSQMEEEQENFQE